jgi:hypothetical protein
VRDLTMRERILAVVHGRELDRVPFVQYDGLAAPNEEVWSVVGRENLGVLRWSAVHRTHSPHCRRVDEKFRRGRSRGVRTTIQTPRGRLTGERLSEQAYGSWHTTEHFVKEPADYELLLALLADTVVVDDTRRFLLDRRDLGDDGCPLVALMRTPYQQLWIEWVSLADLCCHLVDCPDLVQACVHEMVRLHRDVFDIVRRSPVDFVDFGDNITAPVIGVHNFQRYCVPLYDELAGMIHERGARVFVHMDGDLQPLWESIGRSRVGGIDSLSPPPDNDTSAAAAADMWPDMRLFLNFPSSVHLAPPEQVYAAATAILAQAGHTGRLQIQVSENVPADAWPRSFPQIVQAIRDFGRP